MLEIIILYKLWTLIGQRAHEKGHRAIGYQFMVIFFWLGGEVIGALLGGVGIGILYKGNVEQAMFLGIAYVSAIAGACLGAWAAFQIVGNLADLSADAAAAAEAQPPTSTTPLPPVPTGAISAEPMHLPIPLGNSKPAPPSPAASKKEPEVKDTFRELIETVVFVVVLVLMLKTFLAEAFVIPTGSMADTLLGYHHKVTCQQCGFPYLVNASSEADPQDRPRQDVTHSRCENCKAWNPIRR